MLRTTISNTELTLSDVPPADAEWKDIVRFAQTFNGYAEAGSFKECATVANKNRGVASQDLQALTLKDLRVCLFFEYRRWNHLTVKLEGEDLKYIRSLVEELRARVDTKKPDSI